MGYPCCRPAFLRKLRYTDAPRLRLANPNRRDRIPSPVPEPALIALWGSRLAGYAAFAKRPVCRRTWSEMRMPLSRFLVRIRQPYRAPIIAMSTQTEANESLGTRIMEFIRDTVSLDVLTLTGTITLKSAADTAFNIAVAEAEANLGKAEANNTSAENGDDQKLKAAAAKALAQAKEYANAAKQAKEARTSRDSAARKVEEQKKKAALADQQAIEKEAKAKKAEEDQAANAASLKADAHTAREQSDTESKNTATMIGALKEEEAKLTAAKAVLAPPAFSWDTLVAQITSQMEASDDNALKVVAYTHAEWDCDATNVFAKPTDDFEKSLIANHATMVEAAHRSRFEALQSIGAAIKAILPA
jgi:hypothetical protein